ncbi:MAG: hypothetical protein J5695_01125 [Bacteroidales bacterium]|nr:hypothetical protein [Bacteroidales bacterium]
MELRFSDDFLKVLELSRSEALRTGWHNITADHIMLGMLRLDGCSACMVLEALGADTALFKEYLDESLFCPEQIPWEERDSIHPCESALSLLQHSALEARRCGAPAVEPFHFLLAVCRMSGTYSHDWLAGQGLSLRALAEASGLDWNSYGLDQPAMAHSSTAVMTDQIDSVMPDQIGHLPDPDLLASAIEQRLREGYTTQNPHVS